MRCPQRSLVASCTSSARLPASFMYSNKRPSSAAVQVTTSCSTRQHFAPLALCLNDQPISRLLLLSRALVAGRYSTRPRDLPWLELLCRSNLDEMTIWPSPSGSTAKRRPSSSAAMDKGVGKGGALLGVVVAQHGAYRGGS